MRFERRTTRPLPLLVGAPVAAIAAALLLSGGLIALAGAPVFTAFREIAMAAFGSRLAATETLTRSTPLILTGLAAATAFRARLWNIGGEGQLYLGAITTAALGAWIGEALPALAVIPVLMAAGAAAGILWLMVPLILRLRYRVDEVVTTLLLNFVALLFVSMLIEGVLRDPAGFGWPQSVPVPERARLPEIVPRSRLHAGFVLAIVLAAGLHLIQSRTLFGLNVKAAGLNARASAFAGVPLTRTLALVGCLSGGLAGLAGSVEVLGVTGNVTMELSPGYGYSGILIAMLAGLYPAGVIAAAIFAAAMFVGADGMSRALTVPSYISDVTVALALLAMLMAGFFTRFRLRA